MSPFSIDLAVVESEEEYVAESLDHINGQILYYEQIIDTAQRRYRAA